MKTPTTTTEETPAAESKETKTNPQEEHMEKHEDLDYINEAMKGMAVKKLRYLEELIRGHISEKIARNKMNQSGKAKAEQIKAQSPNSPDSYAIQREEENDYI